jgi:hypothetical protein
VARRRYTGKPFTGVSLVTSDVFDVLRETRSQAGFITKFSRQLFVELPPSDQ